MRLSARNRLVGTIESVEKGIITAKVKIRVTEPCVITAVITKESVEDMELKQDDRVDAIAKSTSVMIAKE